MSRLKKRLSPALQLFGMLLTVFVTTTHGALALTQQDLYKQGIFYFDLADGSSCTGSEVISGSGATTVGDTTYRPETPPGSDSEEQVWNFFTAGVGLSPVATAGIMGNIQAESHFNPAAEQTSGAWEDMSSLDINHGGKGGVGLVQWDGGRRPAYINYANKHGADPKTIVPQLNYIWNELNNGYKEVMTGGSLNGAQYAGIQSATDAGQAALTFHALYERSADGPDKVKGRMQNAEDILKQYGEGDSQNINCTPANTLSPECATAVGNARIICAAEKYDPISYREDGTTSTGHGSGEEWHAKYCQTIGPSCYLDCSGLVNIAVYDVYNISLAENTDTERADSTMTSAWVFNHYQRGNGKYWKQISFSQVQPGDIIQPFRGHVEIIDHVQGNTLYTFGAHTSQRPQPQQVGAAKYKNNSSRIYFTYVGPGASGS